MKKRLKPYILLVIYGLIMVLCSLQKDHLFISNCDYFSQHLAFADYFRKLFYETGDFFPDFASAIGGGQNIYNFSYYGLFRPDIFISFLLPFVEMRYILISYSIVLYLVGACLLYKWLKNNHFASGVCLLMGFFFLSSSILFHSHRQIMFVNYMPFLILSLIGIDKYLKTRKVGTVIIGIFLMIIHSYFFSVCGIVICCVYYLFRFYTRYKQSNFNIKHYLWGKDAFFKIFLWMFVGVLLAGILLVPTAVAMLQNMRFSNAIDVSTLFKFNLTCDTILYNYYGCGFPFFIWLVLCVGLTMKKTRIVSASCIIFMLLPVTAYILNGTLYVHTKIYMAFIPVTLYLCAKIIQMKYDKQRSDNKWLFMIILVPVLNFCYDNQFYFIFIIDIMLTAVIVTIASKYYQAIFLIIISCGITCIGASHFEEFVSTAKYEEIYNNEDFVNEYADNEYRFDCLANSMATTIHTPDASLFQTSVYSSIQNKYYEEFMHDVIKKAALSRNRMANTADSNIFFNMFMGTKTLYSKLITPAGYNVMGTDKYGGKLLVNEDVLPIAYTTTSIMDYKDFENISYPYTLDTLVNCDVVGYPADYKLHTVVGANENKINSVYNSNITNLPLKELISNVDAPDGIFLDMNSDKMSVDLREEGILLLNLHNKKNILIISMDISAEAPHSDIYIRINNVTEKLTNPDSLYANRNEKFNFVISSNEPISKLEIKCSKGNYTVNNIQVYSCNYDDISNYHTIINAYTPNKCNKKEILSGHVTAADNGYFITSIPYQKGLTAKIDGKIVALERVNCSFVGFPIQEGSHEISITFNAPGKMIGIVLSLLGLCICLLTFVFSLRKRIEH